MVVREGRLNGFICSTHLCALGGMRVHGNLAADSLEAVHVAITWAEACLPDLRRWLGQADEPAAAAVGDGRVAAHRRRARRDTMLWTVRNT